MRIDLHLHTPISHNNGDAIKWESARDAIKRLHDRGVKAFAFTDHNAFDLNLYREIHQLVEGNMVIFPGIEVDVLKTNGMRAHLLIIFPENLTAAQLVELERTCRDKLRKNGLAIPTINALFANYDTIRIPHVGKSDNFRADELEALTHHAIETTSFTNPAYLTWRKKRFDRAVVAFSDTHIWKKYPQQSILYTEIEFDGTFTDLKVKLAAPTIYAKRVFTPTPNSK